MRSDRRRLPAVSLFWAAAVVSVHGALAGHFVWRAEIEPFRRFYPTHWAFSWIAYPLPGPQQGYFRKTFHLATEPEHCYVQVSALDRFDLHVNGRKVGGSRRVGMMTTRLFDVSGQMRQGRNVVAVASERMTFGERTRILFEGRCTDRGGRETWLGSDSSVKVSDMPERAAGGARWVREDFDDSAWFDAEVLRPPLPSDDTRINFPPVLVTERRGEWSWGPSPDAERVFVRCPFEQPDDTRESWVEAAGADALTLFLNGRVVSQQTQRLGVNDPRPRETNLDTFNATRLVRHGTNVVALTAQAVPSRRRLLVSGLHVGADGRARGFAAPTGCRCSQVAEPGWTQIDFDDSRWEGLHAVDPPVDPELAMPSRRFVQPRLLDLDEELRSSYERLSQLVGALALLALWVVAALVGARTGPPGGLPSALSRHRLPHLFGAVLLAAAMLLRYDSRFSPGYPFRWGVVLASLGLAGLLHLVLFARGGRRPRPVGSLPPRLAAVGSLLLVAAMTVGGFALRIRNASLEPLEGDEVTTAVSSWGIWSRGYPAAEESPRLPIKHLTTSEAVAYPMALFMRLIGPDELGVRFNGILFSAGTIPLLYLIGWRLFDRRTGLLAALLYAGLPFAINMSQYGRYPSQLAFLTALTVFLFYRAISSSPSKPGLLYAAALAYTLTYLSWEGSAFLLPGLLAGLVLVRRRDISWLFEKHLWGAALLVGLAVFLQLSLRLHLNANWPILGQGARELTPVALWRQPLYDPWSYYTKLFLLENLQVVSWLALAGLLFALRSRPLSYLAGILVVVVVLKTNFLEMQDSRHVYYMLPILILVGARGFWKLAQALAGDTRRPRWALMAQAALLGLFLLSANTQVLRLYLLPGNHRADQVRLDGAQPAGVKLAFPFASPDRPPSFPIIAYQPHVASYYLGRADFYAASRLQIPAAVAEDQALAVHRMTGSPMLHSVDDFREALARHPSARVIVPLRGAKTLSRELRKYLTDELVLDYSDSQIAVYTLPFLSGEMRQDVR